MKKIAVLSDVHSNLEALEAVLARVDELGIEDIYSLGDTVGYGPDPEACLRIACDRFRLRLMGNHEYAVLNPESSAGFNPLAKKAIDWTRERITQAGLLDCISELKPYSHQDEILFAHGSVRDALDEYLLESDRSGYSTFDEVVESLENDFVYFRICFVGHNHKPFLATTEGFIHPHEEMSEFQVADDEKLYISVGSVGQPRDGDPRACFVTFDGQTVSYHRVPYDHPRTTRKILALDLPEALGRRLALGK